jgi:hypothetical protein
MDITEKAEKYAIGKVDKTLTNAIAEAYIEGYKDGYREREQEIPMDFRNNKTEFVDLGLPSGTLWAMDYEKEEDKVVFLPHGKSQSFNIPTQEQLEELISECKWTPVWYKRYCTACKCWGPNGATLSFQILSSLDNPILSSLDNPHGALNNVLFWLKGSDCNAANFISQFGGEGRMSIIKVFSGYRVPIRLVR